MDSELNITVSAIDDSGEALSGVAEELDGVGEAASNMSDEMAGAGTAVDETAAGMAAAAPAADETADAMTGVGVGADDAAEGLVATGEAADGATAAMAETEMGGMTMKSALIQVGVAAGIAFEALKSEIEDANADFTTWSQTIQNIQTGLEDTGSSIPLSQILAFTAALSQKTLFSEQDILSSEAQVTSNQDLQASYQSIIQDAADLAAHNPGETLSDAMNLLTTSLTDPTDGMRQLTRQGIDFNNTQQTTIERMAEAGSTAQADAMIMEALTTQIGGLSEKMADLPGAQWTQFWNEIEDFQSVIGSAIAPALDKMAEALAPIITDIANWIEKNPQLTADILIGAAAVSGLVVVMSALAIAVFAAMEVFAVVTSGPITLFVAALPLITAGIVIVATQMKANWQDIQTTITSIAGSIMTFIQGWYNTIIGWINNIINSMKSIGTSIGSAVGGTIGAIGSTLTHLATGGVVSSPTIALIGEAGPEAVIPLSMLGEGGSLGGANGTGGINVYITGTIQSSESQAVALGNKIANLINRQLKLQSYA